MNKESIMDQLADFDFSSPVEANVIFDDDEDQDLKPELVIKEEKTETEDNSIEHLKKILSDTINSNYADSTHREVLDGQVKVGTQIDFAATSSQINTSTVSIETKAKFEGSKPLAKIPELNKNKNLKRKLTEDCSYEPKMCRNITENNNITPESSFQCDQNTPIHQTTLIMQEDPPNVAKDVVNTDNNSNSEMTCISKLLHSVSQNLIYILEAYSRYSQLKESKAASPQEMDKYKAEFIRLKYHFFNLSFCTVDNIILPQEKNLFFTGKFMNDTVKLAASKRRILCLETQVAPLFFELLKWTKEKKLRLSNLPIEAFSNPTRQNENNPLLRQHLRLPVKQLNVSSTSPRVPPDNSNRSVNSQQLSFNTTQINMPSEPTKFVENHNKSQNEHYPNPSQGDEIHNILADLNRQAQQLSVPAQQVSISSEANRMPRIFNGPVNTNAEFGNKMFMTTQGNNYAFNTNNCLPKQHQASNTFVPHANSTDCSKSVVFSSGLPGREISITVEQSLLQPNVNCNTMNTQHPRNVRENPNYSDGQLLPSYEQALNHMKESDSQRNQFHMQQNQQMARQHFSNNYNYQSNGPQGYQNTTATVTPPWQKGPQNHYRSMEVQQIAPAAQPLQIQTEQQNPEITRSISTDSGFMSPLNFNNSSDMNKDGVEESLPSPMITHVTSLHPEVSYISEGLCSVCGKSTRKMCIGCFKRYYCSYPCQRYDWSVHQAMCQK